MKLVEILAREMVEWPETTVCYTQDNDGWCIPWACTPIFDGLFGEWVGSQEARIDRSPIADGFELDVANDHATAIVTREMWEAERARIKNVEWDGQGLPEPGADIEFLDADRVWRPGEYVGTFKGQIVAGSKESGLVGFIERSRIRPPENTNNERQAAIKEMMETVCKGTPWTLSADAAAKLYDAGYRKIVAKK